MTEQIKAFLPVLGVVIIYLNYFLTPNSNTVMIAQTKTYPVFIGLLALAYVIRYGLYWKSPKKRRDIADNEAPRIFAAAIALTLWDYATLKTAILPMPYFPWVDRILNVFLSDWKLLGLSVVYSLRLLLVGYFFGAVCGLISGVLIGWFKKVEYWAMPVVRMIGPVPAVVWIPIVMILSPTTFAGSVFLVGLAVWFPVTLMTASGIFGVSKAYFEVANTLGADEKYLIFNVAIPAALPHVFLGLFQGMGVACVTLISAEMLGVKAGLGWYITSSTAWAEYNKVFASIMLILITFTSVVTLIFRIRDRFLAWQKGVIKW
ncbi:MAG: ABC transporter permease subunit [Synergistaceae bacterium]|nr:ABC transporter permease subunit [Synergistaceae bacterium]